MTTYLLLSMLVILIAIAVGGYFRTQAANKERERRQQEQRELKMRTERLEKQRGAGTSDGQPER